MTNPTKHEHADWCNYKHGRCECGATDQKQPRVALTTQDQPEPHSKDAGSRPDELGEHARAPERLPKAGAQAPFTTDLVTPQQIAADIAREFREDAKRWTQGYWARDAQGGKCSESDARAVCWCLRGAIDKRITRMTSTEVALRTLEEFDRALGFEPDKLLRFVDWNDDPFRTVQEVIDLCDKVAAS